MTIRSLGDFTSRIASAKPGRASFLMGRMARSLPSASADMLVLIAGGIGVTPMMSIIRTFADKGDKRPLLLLYGSRTYEEITFREELEALAGRAQVKVVHVLRNPHEGWSGERGYVDVEILRRHLPPPYAAHEYLICGPDVMMDGIERALGELECRCRATIPSVTASSRRKTRCAACLPIICCLPL